MSDFDPSHKNVKNAEEVELIVLANKFARRRDDHPPTAVFRDKTGYIRAMPHTEFLAGFEAL